MFLGTALNNCFIVLYLLSETILLLFLNKYSFIKGFFNSNISFNLLILLFEINNNLDGINSYKILSKLLCGL